MLVCDPAQPGADARLSREAAIFRKVLISATLLALLACACHPKPAPAEDPLAGAKALIASKDYSAAIEKLEALRTLGGDDPQVAALLMDLYEQQNDPARAILRGRAALALHPDAKALYIPLSRLYTHAKQYQTSKELLLDARKAGVDEKDVAFGFTLQQFRQATFTACGLAQDRGAQIRNLLLGQPFQRNKAGGGQFAG